MGLDFKVKVGEDTYELQKLTLGDTVVLKRQFGLTDLEHFSPKDPEQMIGLVTLAIAKTRGISVAEALEIAKDIDLEEFEPQAPGTQESNPHGADEATDAHSKSSSSAKSQSKRGARSTQKS